MATSSSEKVRLTADLPVEEIDKLKELAAQQGVTLTEALRRAIATEGLLQEKFFAELKQVLDVLVGPVITCEFGKVSLNTSPPPSFVGFRVA